MSFIIRQGNYHLGHKYSMFRRRGGENMNTTNKERFELLMKQIGIPDDMKNKYFQNGSIEKLEVYRQSKIWQFHLLIENVLPAEAYQLFALKLTEAFSTIAKVSWYLKPKTLSYPMRNGEIIGVFSIQN